MRFVFCFLTITSAMAGAVSAHPGHLVDVAGHGHWLGAAAIGAAIAIGVFAGLKGRKRDSETDQAEAEETEPQEA